MEKKKFEVKELKYTIEYLPTKRCRHSRKQSFQTTIVFTLDVVNKHEAPIVFYIHDYNTKYLEASKGDDPYVTYPIRMCNGKYYREYVKTTYNEASEFVFKDDDIFHIVNYWTNSYSSNDFLNDYPDRPFNPENSVKLQSNLTTKISKIQKDIDSRFLIIDGQLFEQVGEPRYYISTLGLGFNHGGTYLSIAFDFNSNIARNMYFRADETDKAYKEAISIAYKRKDTDSVSLLKEGYSSRKNCYIEVLNMDAVRLNLHKETDKENPLM